MNRQPSAKQKERCPAPTSNSNASDPKYRIDPYDLRNGFQFLRELIESSVLNRLDEICEKVRRLESPDRTLIDDTDRAIRLPEVLDLMGGLSKSTLYARLNPSSPSYDPEMPKPFKLGNSVRSPTLWWERKMRRYVQAKSNARSVH